ncbi:snare associated Golgi protein-domain-containing protein [Dunaliella salina]|uniref:Snare associated Golgi protein-domain-containing protein n=1 Tax=Dunaliella salina TaxID=3046 RepID=A0ABQ7GXZ7_DUNSA|nr:snare associated Golgi protein-domain-containing protein [Dunaliella salina]|eukprot:KAF5839477.1 snare associated Golgi protein-domain-containing protein [Dunaliella salina]
MVINQCIANPLKQYNPVFVGQHGRHTLRHPFKAVQVRQGGAGCIGSTQGSKFHRLGTMSYGRQSLASRTCFPVALAFVFLLNVEPAQAFDFNGVVEAISDVAKDLGPFWGAALFTAAYVLFTVLLIPGSILTLAAGALFGPIRGTVVVSIASTLGAVAAFLIARYLAQPWVEAKLRGNMRLQAVISSISAEGTRLVLLLRLSPLFPFAILNYALGLTTISLTDYTLATWLGMIPATFAYVYLGDVGRSAADAASKQSFSPQQLALWGLGAGATLLATKLVSSAANKALKDAEERQQEQQEGLLQQQRQRQQTEERQ